ncbi:hypothetical protein MMA231_04170 (plasmid) [Asticcacaulis sp. MM231]|jgi:hypothetical protein
MMMMKLPNRPEGPPEHEWPAKMTLDITIDSEAFYSNVVNRFLSRNAYDSIQRTIL